ncbi:MAG: hypothetical protein Pars92KO_31140 [Parasphingorhabdus sp.]
MPFEPSPQSPQCLSDFEIPIFSTWIGSWRISIGRRAYSKKELVGHYDKAAGAWNARLGRLGFDTAYTAMLRKVLRQERYAIPLDGLRILDAGIGTGAFSSALLDLEPSRCVLDGVDLSEQMLCQAEQNIRDRNVDLSLKQADIKELPYADAAFDIVLAAHVIEHLECPRTALLELYRVLKPGGLLITCITRRSTAGALVQFVWRSHRVARRQALQWMRETGLRSVRSIPFDKQSMMRKLSLAYVGRKSIAESTSNSDLS